MITQVEPIIPIDSNIYVLTGKKNAVIDTGTGLSVKYVIDRIHEILGAGTVDFVLLTHCHFDHIGGAYAISQAFGCDIYAGYLDAESIRKGDVTYTLCKDFDIDIPGFDVKDLHQDDIIDLGDHRLRVIETPGHTMGGVCYYDEVTKSLFSGDTVFALGYGRTDFKGGSVTSLRNSIKYLSNMEVTGLYSGHGNVTQKGSQAVRRGLELIGD